MGYTGLMISRIRHIAGLVLFAFLCFPLLATASLNANVQYPSWTEIGAKSSIIEGRLLSKLPEFDSDAWLAEKFQSSCDSFMGDHVPMRERVLLSDAGLQRALISFAAVPFEYTVYPTFYDSKYITDRASGLVLGQSKKRPQNNAKQDVARREAWVNALNDAAEKHPDARFVVDLVLQPDQSSVNPSYSLLGSDNLIDEAWVEQEIIEKLDEKLNATLDPIESYDELATLCYGDDHHRQLQRALRSYNVIADKLDLPKVSWNADTATLVCPVWHGSYARAGRDYDGGSTLIDQPDDFPEFDYVSLEDADEDGVGVGLREAYYSSSDKASVPIYEGETYRHFYGGDNMLIQNEQSSCDKTLLLVGDSHTRTLFRYFASNYRKTIYILPTRASVKTSLSDLIDKYEVDDVVVMASPTVYSGIGSTSPDLVGLQ